MSSKQINSASRQHAIAVLGSDEFLKNRIAAKAIMEDFKAGVNWLKEQSTKATA